jgi:hypothetical protein
MRVTPFLAFDTETELARPDRVAEMALMTVSNGQRHIILHPSQVPEFIQRHQGALWVGFNSQYDWWVVRETLEWLSPAWAEWRKVLEQDRLLDAMLLDFLTCLGEDRPGVHAPRGLGEVAQDVLGLEIDKKDPYRMRYAEIIGKDWAGEEWVDPGFFGYAIKDVIATWHIYPQLRYRAERVAQRHGISPEVIRRYGVLTEGLQVKASVVLADIGRQGMQVNQPGVLAARERLDGVVRERVEYLREAYPDVFDRYKTTTRHGKKGSLKTVKGTGVPKLKQEALRVYLADVARELEVDLEDFPRTPKTGELTTSLDPWREACGDHPLVKAWAELMDAAKLLQFLVKLNDPVVYPSYRPLVRTGRTSCTQPNIQQMPREGWFRELFHAREGHTYLVVDYSAIELVTLSSVLLDRFGTSVLAEQIRGGRDPHCYTAAMVLSEPYESVLAGVKLEKKLPDTDPKPYSKARQAAKAINFGVPGGLGAAKLVAYAKANYGVQMTPDEAKALRDKLTGEVYPELGRYLEDSFEDRLAFNLGCTRAELEDAVKQACGDSPGLWYVIARVVGGQTIKENGSHLYSGFVAEVWDVLASLAQDPALKAGCRDWGKSHRAGHRLISEAAVTRTGRVRSGVYYCEARNTPFQGLAADGAKLALWRLWQAGYRIVAFVHDEIVVEVPKDQAEQELPRVEQIMRDAMAEVVGHELPVKVESQVSEVWAK